MKTKPAYLILNASDIRISLCKMECFSMKWIKADKAPKVQGKYLAVVSNSQAYILDYVDGKWYGQPFYSGKHINVTHWMELPKLPMPKDWVYDI
ncbi:MAG: DUF551 domain-containing protein [Proteobacteria bacterium]|nr:DUF551 domain-containing protein [Pseudomonadota bacterium]